MYCDNTRAINIANESGITKGARHFRAKVHYLREVIEFGDIKLEKVHTDDNLADPFTKALAFPKHSELTRNIGMLPAMYELSATPTPKWELLDYVSWTSSITTRVTKTNPLQALSFGRIDGRNKKILSDVLVHCSSRAINWTGPNFIDWYRQLRIVLSIDDKLNYLEQPFPPAPAGQHVAPEILAAHTAWVKRIHMRLLDSCMTMEPEIQRNLENLHANDMLKELKALFAQQAEQELLQTTRDFHACKQEEGQSVSSLCLISYSVYAWECDGFVQNYTCIAWGRNVNELHAIAKAPWDKIKGNGNISTLLLHSQIPPPPEGRIPQRDSICHECGEDWSLDRNCHAVLSRVAKEEKKKQPLELVVVQVSCYRTHTFSLIDPWIYDTGCGYPKGYNGYSFYYPPENKVLFARNAKFLENSLITQEASGSLEDLEIIQKEDTHPSIDTSLNHEEDVLEWIEPQNAYYDYENLAIGFQNCLHSNGYLNEEVYWSNLKDVKSYLGKCFAMKDLGEAAYILGIKIYRDRSRRLIGLMSKDALSKKSFKAVSHGVFQTWKAVGSIMYALRCTRPDVAFAQNITSQFQQNPGDLQWTTVKNILKYLRNTKDMFLVYGGDLKRELRVSCYTDAGYLTDADDLKSQTGYVFVLNGVMLMEECQQAFSLLIGRTIAIAKESGITKGARHFRAKVHYLRKVIEFGDIKLEKVHTDNNLADPFTKALAFPKHSELTRNIGMLPASSFM
ncbi:hypothetical protein Tco_0851075 [Tanacetum coccineum]